MNIQNIQIYIVNGFCIIILRTLITVIGNALMKICEIASIYFIKGKFDYCLRAALRFFQIKYTFYIIVSLVMLFFLLNKK